MQEPMRHRVLVIYETDGLPKLATYIVRSLLSEGRISYSTVTTVDGEPRTVRIEQEGPTGLITTTTKVLWHHENETRLISIGVSDDEAQTREVMREIMKEEPAPFDFGPWHALQRVLAASDNRVAVPAFGGVLADVLDATAVRMRRDLRAIRTLIQTHAFLHQENRERDASGAIVPTLDDYATVHGLMEASLAEALDHVVAPETRAAVEAVNVLYRPNDQDEDRGVTVAALAEHMDVDRATAQRRVAAALDRELLRDLGRGGRGQRKRLAPGEPMPEGSKEVLPSPERLRYLCNCARTAGEGDPAEEQLHLEQDDPTDGDEETDNDGQEMPF